MFKNGAEMLLKQGFFEFERRKKFMAFFSNGEDKLKLMILFTLECAEMPLSREQIATVMSENGVENYFDVCEHIIDLEANGCIASVPTFKMQMIVMTPRGEEIMNLFGKNLPKSLRESIEGFVGSNKDEFRRENTSRIITTPLPDGGFDATFALVENGDAIFEIRIKLPNAEYTRLAEKNWEAQNQKIYIDTLLALVKTYQNAQNSDAAETCTQDNI